MKEIKSPGKAIRAKCLECSNGNPNEVRYCPCTDCPLYVFRFGKNPYRTPRQMTDEQREAAASRMRSLVQSNKLRRKTNAAGE